MRRFHQLTRVFPQCWRACHTGHDAPIKSIAAAARTKNVQALDLSRSPDLLCHNLVCEKVGQPCICRLAQVLGRHAGSLRWLSLAGNGLEQLPEALTALPRLRYLDLSGNRLSALPQGFTNLQCLEVLNLSANEALMALPFSAADLPALAVLLVDPPLEKLGAAGREVAAKDGDVPHVTL